MTVLDFISPLAGTIPESLSIPEVDAREPLLSLLHKLVEAPYHRLAVRHDGVLAGEISADDMLEAMAAQIAPRDDSSVIVATCRATDFSASVLARAVEDADANLVDFLSQPDKDSNMRITMRVSHTNPSAVCRSLERYGFKICEAFGQDISDSDIYNERIKALQVYLNV